MIGRYGASIGKVFYGKDGAYNVALVKLIWDNNILLQDFVYQMFSARIIQEFFQNCTRSAQAGFNKTDMGKLNITLPPLEEQKAIVEVVNALFKEVEQLEELTKERICLKEDFVTSALRRLTETDNTKQEWNYLQQHFSSFFTEKKNIKSLRETILQLAVQGKLTAQWRADNPNTEPASELLKRIEAEKQQLIAEKKIKKEKPLPPVEDEDKPYDLPDGWVWCRLKAIGYITGGGTPSKGKSTYWDGDIPWVSPKDMKSVYINDSQDKVTMEGVNNSSAKLIPVGSLLIVGRSGILKRTIPVSINQVICTVNQDLKVIVPIFKQMNEYIRLGLKGMEGRLLKDFVKYGMTVHSLKYSEFELMTFPLPPKEEQQAIVEKVNSLMALCDELEQQVDNSQSQIEQLMQSCLKEVFA